MDRNDFSEEEALARINSQLSLEEKKSKADHVVDNTGIFSETGKQFELIHIFHNKWSLLLEIIGVGSIV